MLSVASQPFMLNVVMLNVVKMDVVAPVTYNPCAKNDGENFPQCHPKCEGKKDNRKAPRHSVE
jgi:hypothetical protein